jgi:hypothetical protein
LLAQMRESFRDEARKEVRDQVLALFGVEVVENTETLQ